MPDQLPPYAPPPSTLSSSPLAHDRTPTPNPSTQVSMSEVSDLLRLQSESGAAVDNLAEGGVNTEGEGSDDDDETVVGDGRIRLNDDDEGEEHAAVVGDVGQPAEAMDVDESSIPHLTNSAQLRTSTIQPSCHEREEHAHAMANNMNDVGDPPSPVLDSTPTPRMPAAPLRAATPLHTLPEALFAALQSQGGSVAASPAPFPNTFSNMGPSDHGQFGGSHMNRHGRPSSRPDSCVPRTPTTARVSTLNYSDRDVVMVAPRMSTPMPARRTDRGTPHTATYRQNPESRQPIRRLSKAAPRWRVDNTSSATTTSSSPRRPPPASDCVECGPNLPAYRGNVTASSRNGERHTRSPLTTGRRQTPLFTRASASPSPDPSVDLGPGPKREPASRQPSRPSPCRPIYIHSRHESHSASGGDSDDEVICTGGTSPPPASTGKRPRQNSGETSKRQRQRTGCTERAPKLEHDSDDELHEILPGEFEQDTEAETQTSQRAGQPTTSSTTTSGPSGPNSRSPRRAGGRGSKVLSPSVRAKILDLLLGNLQGHTNGPEAHIQKVTSLRGWEAITRAVGARPEDAERVRHCAKGFQETLSGKVRREEL